MKRLLLLVLVAAASALLAAVATAAPQEASQSTSACGVDRWTVKTLQDRPRLLPARKTTIHYLITRPAPKHIPDTRLPFERHVYTVVAPVVLVRPRRTATCTSCSSKAVIT